MQCARSVRVRKSRPVSQFCHTLFTTDIISYIQVTLKHVPFEIPPCFYPVVTCLLHCTVLLVNPPKEILQKSLSHWSRRIGVGFLQHMQALTAPTPSSVLSTAFMCMVMLIAYCWLSLLPIPSFISSSLVKRIKMHWPLCCLLSRLLYWVFVSLCAPLPAASKSLFPLFLTLPPFFNLCLSLLCCAWRGAEEEGECLGRRYQTPS